MNLGRVEGKIWASIKDDRLQGVKLYILQPIDEFEKPQGDPIIAADTIGTCEGDLVYWVNSTEASFLLEERAIPSEISIVGFVERLDIGTEFKVPPKGKAVKQPRKK